MVEVKPGLFVGSDIDAFKLLKSADAKGFAILHCAKEQWHKRAVGYTQRSLPNTHPEYLWALRGNELALNMVDAEDTRFFAEPMVSVGLEFIKEKLGEGMKVLCHCNQGGSRGPSMAMLSMRDELSNSFEEAECEFRMLYPAYNPRNGVRGYLMAHWE